MSIVKVFAKQQGLSTHMAIFVKLRLLTNIHSLNLMFDFIFFIDILIDSTFVIDF